MSKKLIIIFFYLSWLQWRRRCRWCLQRSRRRREIWHGKRQWSVQLDFIKMQRHEKAIFSSASCAILFFYRLYIFLAFYFDDKFFVSQILFCCYSNLFIGLKFCFHLPQRTENMFYRLLQGMHLLNFEWKYDEKLEGKKKVQYSNHLICSTFCSRSI